MTIYYKYTVVLSFLELKEYPASATTYIRRPLILPIYRQHGQARGKLIMIPALTYDLPDTYVSRKTRR